MTDSTDDVEGLEDLAMGLLARHQHKESRTCTCYILALEPDETCPIHGAGEWPPRCAECGQFMERKP